MGAGVMRKFFIVVLVVYVNLLCNLEQKIVYIIPHSDKALVNKDYAASKRLALKKLGYSSKICSGRLPMPHAEKIVCFHHTPDLNMIHNLMRFPKERLILFLREPPTLFPALYSQQFYTIFGMVYSWHDGLVAQKKWHKFFYAHALKPLKEWLLFENKKFCCMFATNKHYRSSYELYSQRRALVRYFEYAAPKELDLYGRGWPSLKVAKGHVVNKNKILKNYKFCICYENSRNLPGYITEKIFDAFVSGVVPVYWGDQSIKKIIPSECFIDREQFSSDHALYVFLKKMSKSTYKKYRDAIYKFLKSDAAQLFSKTYFMDIFLRAIESTYQKDIVFTCHEQEILERCYAAHAKLLV